MVSLHPAPHPSGPDIVATMASMQKAIADLQAGLREDHVKFEVMCETLREKRKVQTKILEDLQAETRDQKATNEAQAETNLSRGRMIETLMASHRCAQTLTSGQMLEKCRKPLREAARREDTDTVAMLIQRVRDDPNATEFDQWVLDEYANVSELIRGHHRGEMQEIAQTNGSHYDELYQRLYASE